MINELHSIKAKVYSPVKMNTTLNAGIAKPEAGLRERVDEVEKQVEDLQLFDEEVSKALKQQDENTQTIANKIVEIDEKDETQDRSIELLEEQTANLEEQNENQDRLIEDLQNQVVELEAENENLKNQIPSGKEQGENITLTDSSDMEFKELIIGGNSWQETRSGKNKLPITKKSTTIDGVNITFNEDKSITLNGTNNGSSNLAIELCLAGELMLSENTTYKLTGRPGVSGIYLQATYYKDGVRAYVTADGEFTTAEANDSLTANGFGAYAYIRFDKGVTANNLTIYPMITLATETDLSYEPYGATPSPEIPSPIRNVGDNVNEFDKDNPKVIDSPISSSGIGVSAIDTYKTIYLECKPNETYAISKKYDETKNRFAVAYTYSEPTAKMTEIYGYKYDNNAKELTITTDGNAKYLIAYVWVTGGSTSIQEMLDSIKIEKGTKATPYSPYNCGNFNEMVINENMLYYGWAEDFVNRINNNAYSSVTEKNGKKYLFFSAAAGYVKDQDFKDRKQYFIKGPFKENTQYTFSSKIMLSTERKETNIAMRYTDGTTGYIMLSEKAKAMEEFDFSLTSRADKTLYSVEVDYQTGHTYIDLSTATLKEGTSTEYIPHQSQQYTFPLKPGQRMYKDSYLADDGVHHKRGRYYLKNANFMLLANHEDNSVFQASSPSGIEFADETSLCNIATYEYLESSSIKMNKIYTFMFNNRLYIRMSTADKTLEEFLSMIEKTDAYIEHKLANEVIEPYTEEQQKAYDEIKKAHSYKNVTHIFSTDEIKPVVEVTYRKDLNTIGGDDYVITETDKKEIAETVEPLVRKNIQPTLNEIKAISQQAETIARGRATGYVFDTLQDLEIWLQNNQNISKLVLGDNFYIRELDVPDYWWDGSQKQQLEAEKPVLTGFVKEEELEDYATKEYIDILIGDIEKELGGI